MNWLDEVVAPVTALSGLASALYFLGSNGREKRKERREGRNESDQDRHNDRADTAALIEAYETALKDERGENGKLRERIDEQDKRIQALNQTVEKQQLVITRTRRRYEQEVAELREQLDQATKQSREATRQAEAVARRLDELQKQLHPPEDK